MKIFISWSGNQTLPLAHELKAFFATTFAGHVNSFLSDVDIAPGERFLSVINGGLEESTLGVLLLTRANMAAPWILFEAGALAGKTSSGSVVPLLVDIERSELNPPLSQFNNIYGGVESDIRKLCARINAQLGGVLNPESFELLFAKAWPQLQAAIEAARNVESSTEQPAVPRTVEDVLDEILLGVNSLVRTSRTEREQTLALRPPSTRNSDFTLYPGDVIVHDDFGEGVVTEVTGEGAKRIANVNFSRTTPKRILIKIAPITVVERSPAGAQASQNPE